MRVRQTGNLAYDFGSQLARSIPNLGREVASYDFSPRTAEGTARQSIRPAAPSPCRQLFADNADFGLGEDSAAARAACEEMNDVPAFRQLLCEMGIVTACEPKIKPWMWWAGGGALFATVLFWPKRKK